MRRKITSCDNCRIKKIKCEGKDPCNHCFMQSINCTHNHIPKEVFKYQKKKIIKNNDINGCSNTSIVKQKKDVGNHLLKIQSLLSNLTKKLENLDNYKENTKDENYLPESLITMIESSSIHKISITENENRNKYEFENRDEYEFENRNEYGYENKNEIISKLESYDKLTSGDYLSASSFSRNGLNWAANRIQDPLVVKPLKKLINNFVNLEKNFLSVWVEPVDSSRLSSLPPRHYIQGILRSKHCFFDLPSMTRARHLANIYCDFRDGIGETPTFGYGDLFYLNVCLLLGCALQNEKVNGGITKNLGVSLDQTKVYERSLLENSLYYFHRISITGGGLSAVEGLIVLSFYADMYSVTLPLSSVTTFAIRQAQDLGLHKSEYYTHLDEFEKLRALTVWWICYYRDKSVAMKTGKFPLIDDTTVTAPSLPYLAKSLFKLNTSGQKSSLQRTLLFEVISSELDKLIDSPNGYTKFYLIIQVDLQTIVSEMYKNLVSAPNYGVSYVKYLLSELEYWAMCFPESLRPGCDSAKYTNSVDLTESNISFIFLLTDLTMQYYYLKMRLNMFAMRASFGSENEMFCKNGLDSARYLLRFAVGKNSLGISGFSMFYTFSAFLTLSAFCLQDPNKNDVAEDVGLLISSCRELYSYSTEIKSSPEQWIIISAVSRCVIYILINYVMEQNKRLYFYVGDILNEVSEIQITSTYYNLKERSNNDELDPPIIESSSGECSEFSHESLSMDITPVGMSPSIKFGEMSDFAAFKTEDYDCFLDFPDSSQSKEFDQSFTNVFSEADTFLDFRS